MMPIGILMWTQETDYCFYVMAAMAVFSCIPFNLRKGLKSYVIYLPPLVSLVSWIAYEHFLLNAGITAPIRLDVIFLLPVFCISLIASLTRLSMVLRRR